MSFKIKKAVQALNFIASSKGGVINKMKALKLIWLADRLHLRKYGRPIFEDSYIAMPNGPVASSTRDILEGNFDVDPYVTQHIRAQESNRYFYSASGDLNMSVFSKTDISCLEEVLNKYNHLNQFDLSELSHKFPEWKRWEERLRAGGRYFQINLDDFFEINQTEDTIFDQSEEHLDLSKQIYNGSCF